MALETGTYIDSLVISNPVDASDQVASVGGHLRLIKSAIKATFPNLTGAVTVTQTELSHLAGVTSAVQTQLSAKAAAGANADITSLTGLTTPLSVAQGGTGAASNAASPFALKGANTDITSLNAPALGAATATTQAASDDSTKVATTAFVKAGSAPTTYSSLSLAFDTNYTNTTSKVVFLMVIFDKAAGSAENAVNCLVNGYFVWRAYMAGGAVAVSMTMVIAPGGVYSFNKATAGAVTITATQLT